MAFRTQKISQMTPKGSDLEATDLIEVSTIESGSYVTRSITGQEIIDAAVGNVDWGDIGGTLSDQTDLNTALSGKVPTTRTLTINGTTQDLSADRTFTISTGITIGTTAITSGTVGRVLFEGTGNVVQESANLFWDNTNGRLGIGGVTPFYNLIIYNASAPSFALQNSSRVWQHYLSGSNYRFGTSAADMINIAGATGNVGINTFTDAGFRLDVNGTARVQDTLTVVKNQNLGTSLNITNTTSNFLASAVLTLTSDASSGNAQLGKYSTTTTAYKTLSPKDVWIYNSSTGGDISILNDFATGRIKFAAGASSTAQMTLFSTGNLGINTTTDAGFRLDVNGTARVTSSLRVESSFSALSSATIGGTTLAANAILQVNGSGKYVNYNSSFSSGSFLTYQAFGTWEAIGADSPAGTILAFGGYRASQWTGITFHSNGSERMRIKSTGVINMSSVPTSSAGLSAGDIWNDAGTLKIV